MAKTQLTLLLDVPATSGLATILINHYCGRGYNVNHSCRQCFKRTLETWGYDADAYDQEAIIATRNRHSRQHRQRWNVKGDPERAHAHRRIKYGIMPAEFQAKLQEQDSTCALCRQPETHVIKGTRASLAVDHDHKTGKIRGLLCMKCNIILGRLEQVGEDWIRLAKEYLKLHGSILLARERIAKDELMLGLMELQDASHSLRRITKQSLQTNRLLLEA